MQEDDETTSAENLAEIERRYDRESAFRDTPKPLGVLMSIGVEK